MGPDVRAFLMSARDFVTGRSPSELLSKGYRVLRREGLGGIKRILLDLFCISYSEWIRRHDTLTEQDRLRIRQHIEVLPYRPQLSVLMPVYDPPAVFLARAIDSVRSQLYPDWELCIADDASMQPHVREQLEKAAREDARIRISFRQQNGHISAASNTALDLARGEFIVLLDHDDELSEHALYHIAAALNENRNLDLLYSDEDKIDSRGQRFGHYFKPDWNPDLLLSQNMISHLGVYRRDIARRIGGFRQGYEGSQDWDFALRFVDGIPQERIRHIPHVLYHWRAISGSTAVTISAKDYAVSSARRALQDHWHRRGIEAGVEAIAAGHFLTRLPLPEPPPKVTLVLNARNRADLLRQCVEGISQRTSYADRELIVVGTPADDAASLRYLEELRDSEQARVLACSAPMNSAAACNLAVRQARGELICLLNIGLVPAHASWLAEMVAHALREEIGAVGAMLYGPTGAIMNAGTILDGVSASTLHQGYPKGASGYGNRARLTQNVSAVTDDCLVIRKAIWDEVGGMDEGFAAACSDVDFCLRVREKGYRNLWTPLAELHCNELARRGKACMPGNRASLAGEVAHLQERWGRLIANDPAWNPNLALNGTRVCLASPPRITQPWLRFDA